MCHRLFLVLTIHISGCFGPAYDPADEERFGAAAVARFRLSDRSKLPASIADAWDLEGGNFSGTIYYASFQCETLEDCWAALAAFGAPDKSRFVPGLKTQYAVNQHGPSFYWPDFDHPKWDISSIRNGMFYETAEGDQRMNFWAIDLDELRVYFHYESGGFPTDPPSKRHRWSSAEN